MTEEKVANEEAKGQNYQSQQHNIYTEHDKSKTFIGVLFAIFGGVLGLIAGLMLYPDGTYSRETFFRGWLCMIIIELCILLFVLSILLFIYLRSIIVIMSA